MAKSHPFCFAQDFANTIPGHGGIMDRFDCQYLMATFVNVYIASFIRYLLLCGEVWGPCQTQGTYRLLIRNSFCPREIKI